MVIAVAAIVGMKIVIERYLHSDRFRQFVSRKTGETLHAAGELEPLDFSGSSFYTAGFRATGSEASAFSKLRLEQVRADVSARRIRDRVWQVDQVTVQRMELRLDGPRVPLAATPEEPVRQPQQKDSGWLPNRVEVGAAAIHDTNLEWTDGALHGARLKIMPRDGGWDMEGEGGRIEQAGLPPVEIANAHLRYRAPTLFIQSAELLQSGGGVAKVTGEVRPVDALELHATLTGISITPLLAPDWRVRLHGNLAGEIDVRSALPAGSAGAVVSGKVTLQNGQLEALPVLDEIAAFTRLQQFRRLPLSRASADFREEKGRLAVRNLVAESAGLVRVEGEFAVVDGAIVGTFSVGVTPSSLQWLPGSQERVFTTARDGYVWTPMRLTGPLAAPVEDLSPRLTAAARGAVIERVQTTVEQGVKTGREAVKSALDFLLPPR